MASRPSPDSQIITHVDPEATAIARRYMDDGYGTASRSPRPSRRSRRPLGAFDIVFIDADKPNYKAYYEATLPLLAEDGVLIADNVIWSGRVVEEDEMARRSVKDFNEHVANDDRSSR